MNKLFALLFLSLALAVTPARAQNEGPCAFDFECGDVGKCVKAKPEDSIGACALADGVKAEDLEDESADNPSNDVVSAAAMGIDITRCRLHGNCAPGEACYAVKGQSFKMCAPRRPGFGGLGFLTTDTTACQNRAECRNGEMCFVSKDTGEGLCAPTPTATAEQRGFGRLESERKAQPCSFDTECEVDSVCYKERGQITGTCGPKRSSRDGRVWDGDARGDGSDGKGEKCFTDATCGYGFRCFKAMHEHEGVCGRSNSELGRDDTFGGSWDDRKRRDQLRDMEQMLGRQCMQDRECGPGLRCATVRGRRECVLP